MVLFDPPSVAGWGHNEYWLSTARQWNKATWANNLKGSADERGVLQNLDRLSTQEAVDEILRFYSIFDASDVTR